MTDVPSPSMGQENPEHAHMLANVWMNAQKLAEMVKSEGLIYKKGKFSAIEEAQLNAAIEHYRICKGLTEDQLTAIIFSKEKGRDSFWSEITSALHLRPIIAVYHHVRRTRHPLKQQGRWVPAEDDLLLQAVVELGQQWEKISERNRDLRHSGHWTKGEEAELTQIVTEMTVEQGKDIDNDIFWGVVSDRMGGKRGRQQCRIKWTDSLSTQIKNSGERPRWNQMDAYILVHKIDSLNVRDDSEIDWKQLPDEHWNLWSAHALQRRWLTMKRGIKGYEDMSHFEIMEILKTKKAQSPPPPLASRKKKNKVVSAEAVVDSDDIEGISADATHLQAGPSTGLGTHAAATAA
ncbi:Cyclin-D-binding Myb-like transcription factor 1 [Grifola frondosa]|uniref:Cyclin-D-binding Myb-like transcription factor 1 n=1 Tax=Grifola frondosa TaxID=5627 RepID=A0A1C7M1K9_GRIFR|nr:Cyclin-D-binding Myb-like transcription factor 1 [Grifola frondosa]